VSISELEGYVESLIRQHRHHWRKDVGEPGAASVLLYEALGRMEMLRLIDVDPKNHVVTPLPAIGRFAVGYSTRRCITDQRKDSVTSGHY